MPIISELEQTIGEARADFTAARDAFINGRDTEREVVSRALGLLAVQFLQPDLTDGQRMLVEGHQEFLREILREA